MSWSHGKTLQFLFVSTRSHRGTEAQEEIRCKYELASELFYLQSILLSLCICQWLLFQPFVIMHGLIPSTSLEGFTLNTSKPGPAASWFSSSCPHAYKTKNEKEGQKCHPLVFWSDSFRVWKRTPAKLRRLFLEWPDIPPQAFQPEHPRNCRVPAAGLTGDTECLRGSWLCPLTLQ